jgi:cyclopropane fatty-acyl-phospholipid synthase-like methyltransferase
MPGYVKKGSDVSEDRPQWLFDESVQVGVDYTDSELVSHYDNQHEGFRYFEDEANKIAMALGLTEQSVELDIGCGTGGLTIRLAAKCR